MGQSAGKDGANYNNLLQTGFWATSLWGGCKKNWELIGRSTRGVGFVPCAWTTKVMFNITRNKKILNIQRQKFFFELNSFAYKILGSFFKVVKILPIIISQSPRGRLPVACFVWPTAQNSVQYAANHPNGREGTKWLTIYPYCRFIFCQSTNNLNVSASICTI